MTMVQNRGFFWNRSVSMVAWSQFGTSESSKYWLNKDVEGVTTSLASQLLLLFSVLMLTVGIWIPLELQIITLPIIFSNSLVLTIARAFVFLNYLICIVCHLCCNETCFGQLQVCSRIQVLFLIMHGLWNERLKKMITY